MKRGSIRRCAWTVMALAAAPLAMAQETADEGGLGDMLAQVEGTVWIGVGLMIVILVAGMLFLMSRGSQPSWETMYSEPEPRSSKFEMLLAEIQGLSLRVQNGESKGYYRKIETLGRVLLERIGHAEARKMTEQEVAAVLQNGRLPQAVAAKLGDIFERCRQGMVHESEKLDFTAAELLRDLRHLVEQVEDAPQQKEA